jgi:hypothetical protein
MKLLLNIFNGTRHINRALGALQQQDAFTSGIFKVVAT